MIEDASGIPAGLAIHAETCIVGGGPAGIVLALRLAERRHPVLLLESGGMSAEPAAQRLNRGETANALHKPPDWFRLRKMGGATGIWGGRCVPFDAADLAARPWIPESGWPIGPEALAPYYAAANALCEAGDFDYSGAGLPPILAGFTGAHFSDEAAERFSCPTDFGVRYRHRLQSSARIHVLLHATVTAIRMDVVGTSVRALEVRTARGAPFTILPRRVVLAAGGLEIPRLLLASNDVQPNGVGNDNDRVGRYYMCHLAGTTAELVPAPHVAVRHEYARGADGVYCRRRFALSARAQMAFGTGNFVARLHHPRAADPRHRSAALSALHLARPLIAREYAVRLAAPRGALAPHLANLLRDPLEAAGFAFVWTRRRVLASRKFPSVVLRAKTGGYSLDFHAEQVPNPESRVRLAASRDAFGMQQLAIHWRYSPLDLHTVRRAVELFAQDIAASGCGELRFDPASVEADALRDGAYGGHHIGTARMSASPRDGVVDADCHVHGVRNLFVAGSAVFATSSQANPTLTIVALSLRLADRLAPP